MIVRRTWGLALLSALFVAGCAGEGDEHGDEDHDHDHDHETEIISRVELHFTPSEGGETLTFTFSDPDGDGGESGVAETIELVAGTEYTLEIGLLNDLADPPEDIGEEVAEEAEEHLLLIAGEGVSGPASSSGSALLSHAYADLESDYGTNAVGDDLPVGIVNTITADTSGTSTLRVILRHLPELNEQPVKSAELPAMFAAGEALPGDVDVDVSFDLVVN